MSPPATDVTDRPDIPAPVRGLFQRMHDLGISALRTIPYVGESVSEFVDRAIYPVLAPRRDRAVGFLFRNLRRLEDRLHVVLIRLFPLPPPLPSRDPDKGPR